MYKISAHDIKVYKKAGLYPEEALVANEFLVSVNLAYEEKPDELQDYESLVHIVYQTADSGFSLLEEWAEKIKAEIQLKFSFLNGNIAIKKLHPAITKAELAWVGIELEF